MKTKDLQKYSKELSKVDFTVRINKYSVVVKIGKKDNVCRCPSVEYAQELSQRLNNLVGNIRSEINEAIILMNKNVTQVNLFSGGV